MRWILIILLVFLTGLQYRLWIGPGSFAQVDSLHRELTEQTQINNRLQQRNEALENDIQNLKNGLDSVEERARAELGLIKEGETFYLLIDDNK